MGMFGKLSTLFMLVAMLAAGCAQKADYMGLQAELEDIIARADARVGIAVIIDSRDTVGVNMDADFPMFSVYKFPIAMALGDVCRNVREDCIVSQHDLHHDTYSPMLEVYAGADTARIGLRELLCYSLQQSDNNASDLLLRRAGGAQRVARFLDSIGAGSVKIRSTEAEMYADHSLCYANCATPRAMAALFDRFDRDYTDDLSIVIKEIMEKCATGADRLAAPLVGTDAVLGHKTGTGFVKPDGRLMAVNDCGYVHLPDGRRYAIAVFIADSGHDMATTSAIIARLSAAVYTHLTIER